MPTALHMAGQVPHQPLPPSAQSKIWCAHDQASASSMKTGGSRPARTGPAGLMHSQTQQQLWSKGHHEPNSVPQQQSSWGTKQKFDAPACLGAGLQPPATPEPHHRPRSCILPQVTDAIPNDAQMGQQGLLRQTALAIGRQSSQHDWSRSDAGKPLAISSTGETSRMTSEPGRSDGTHSQPCRATEHRSMPWAQPTLASGTGVSAGGHLPFSRHSRGQHWARCNSAPGPVPLAPLSFCWQQGHLPDIYQNMSASPSRLKAQAHRGGQGAKSCLAW